MNGGVHVFDYVLDGLRGFGGLAIPALRLGTHQDAKEAVARALPYDGHGVAVVIGLEDLMQSNVRARVLGLVSDVGGHPSEADIVIDMGAPEYEPYGAFANALMGALTNLGDMGLFRNLVLIGTAIPESMSSIAKGSDEIPRHDWLFYQTLVKELLPDSRLPVYGDYTIVHPSFAATMDMRMVRPAGKVVYTKSKSWGTRKGSAFFDDRGQMRSHCSVIVRDPQFEFRGSRFSSGDEYIAGCANGSRGVSNQTRWKEVGINHHITTVVCDSANLLAGSSIV